MINTVERRAFRASSSIAALHWQAFIDSADETSEDKAGAKVTP